MFADTVGFLLVHSSQVSGTMVATEGALVAVVASIILAKLSQCLGTALRRIIAAILDGSLTPSEVFCSIQARSSFMLSVGFFLSSNFQSVTSQKSLKIPEDLVVP